MRYGPEHKQHTREQILVEASKAVRQDGPDRVSVQAVMKRAGLTHGGFYAHFESKDAMLVATFEHMFGASRDRWIKLTYDKSPADSLVAYLDWYLSKAHRENRETGCALAALSSDLPRMSPACQKAFGESSRIMVRWIAGLIAKLPRPDPDTLALSVMAELVGALALARAEPDAARVTAILAGSRASVKRKLGLPPPG